jgi:hypothetical protein
MWKLCLIAVIFFCFGNLFAQVNLDSGLVAFYPFQGNAIDESGNGNDGTVMGAIPTTDRFGIDSAAYEFDGTSSYITVPSSPSLESPDTALTQAAWIYLYGWSLVGQQGVGPIIMKSNSGNNAFQYRLSIGVDGINTAINNWNNAVLIPDTLNFNEWYFILTTLINDTVKTYVNGNLLAEGLLTGPINSNNLPLEIGRDVPGAIEVFYGKIDDLRIYNRALNILEIDSLFNEQPTFVNISNSNLRLAFELEQNYPNPFNPSTKINYSVPQLSQVQIKVFDVLGNEIETLVNEEKPAGTYELTWNAANLPSGVYFYRIQAGSFIDTKKMILLK